MLTSRVADPDPGSSAFLTHGSGILYPGWAKNLDPDLGSGMNIPGHIPKSIETWVNNT
jgi:hypothetical protein